MALDSAHLQRAASPASSGGSSPVNFKARSAVEDGINRKDKNYRRYASAVERALSLFDTALQEWADYIPFLGRLQKAFQYRPPGVQEIPHKFLVAKRLAQCLNPALPSGVHQKTIEVYSHIFSVLGTHGLARDLPIFLPGLSSTLTFASLSIRPSLLSLFEGHILVLGSLALRPALKAIILALLPGLDEETSEEYERTHAILNRFKIAVGKVDGRGIDDRDISSEQYFWQCLFLASITSTSRRQGALAFLVRNLPPLGKGQGQSWIADPDKQKVQENESERASSQATEAVTSPEPGLLIRCFATGLRDEQVLIQRGFLDLLVSHLPLSCPVLQERVGPQDLERLVAAAASVTARREMSLNRRLWAWLLGPENAADPSIASADTAEFAASGRSKSLTSSGRSRQSLYFHHFSLRPLVQSIKDMIATTSLAPLDRARPFRICLSLMDRWEIGGVVVAEIFLPLLESVWLYQKAAPSPDAFDEVQRSASVFFDGVESGLMWGEIIKIMRSAFDDHADIHIARTRMELVLFIVTHFNVREEEMQTLHIPLAILVLVVCLRKPMQQSPDRLPRGCADLLTTALRVILHLQDQVSERAYTKGLPAERLSISDEDAEFSMLANMEYTSTVQAFYEAIRENTGQGPLPSDLVDIGRLQLQNVVQMVLLDLRKCPQASYFELEINVLDKSIRTTSSSKLLDHGDIMSALIQASDVSTGVADGNVSLKTITAIVSTLETFCIAFPSTFSQSSNKVRQLIPNLVPKVWPGLSPCRPNCNVEAARCIWRLHLISPNDQIVEATIAALLRTQSTKQHATCEIESARRFGILWTHCTSSPNGIQALRPRSARRVHKKTEGQKGDNQEFSLLGRPLLLLLDCLSDTETQLFGFVVSWLQSLPNVQLVLEFIFRRLKSTTHLNMNLLNRSLQGVTDSPQDSGDPEECIYYLKKIANLITYSPSNTWASLAATLPSIHTERKNKKSNGDPEKYSASSSDHDAPMCDQIARICATTLEGEFENRNDAPSKASAVRQLAANILHQMLSGPAVKSVLRMDIVDTVIGALMQSVKRSDSLLQVCLMDLTIGLLRARSAGQEDVSSRSHRRVTSGETSKGLPRLSFSAEKSDRDDSSVGPPGPPPTLMDSLILGLSSQGACPVLENWVQFLDDCLPFYRESAFQILMPLVDCINKTIRSIFKLLRGTFDDTAGIQTTTEPLTTLISLLNGLERALARAHERLIQYEAGAITLKTPEQAQGFFGNMVAGVFTPETNRSRSTSANNRLTVLLCFKDAVHICFEIWIWGDQAIHTLSGDIPSSASFHYTSIRLKNRVRRILEHLFIAEALECLETLIDLWQKSHQGYSMGRSGAVLNLLHALDGSRPKNTIPAIFNSMYSRTNPNALDPNRKSSLTSSLSDTDLAGFLVAYMQSLEDDAMDEIWSDCMTFLRDVLSNPMPHRQTLPRLLEFTAILGHKIDNTSFGEQRGMRRDLGDLFVRLLAATFTIKPLSFPSEATLPTANGRNTPDSPLDANSYTLSGADNIVTILASIIPMISKILIDTDRVTAACSTISAQVLIPTFRSKTYPHNVTASTLSILNALSRITEASKLWRKDVAEAFHDARFFGVSSLPLVEGSWMPVLRQWAILDKDRLPDLLSRITPPTSAGIMFGVGATSARLEADRKTQLNLRRVALLFLAAANDSFVVNLNLVQEKVSELLLATASSSPSSATRGEIYMLLRALLLRTSSMHLASFWPSITSELYEAISSLFPGDQGDNHNVNGVLQACRLLDTLLVLAPDDFQLREWLFVTDTIDAVYRPQVWEPTALVDDLVESLDSGADVQHVAPTPTVSGPTQNGKRRPLIGSDAVRGVPKGEIVDRVLRPFFRQLSIHAFESTYSMGPPDWRACYDILLSDLFDDSTIA